MKKLGLAGGRGFIVLDQSPQPGGAWQYRWPSLTLSTVDRIHDLPGMALSEALPDAGETQRLVLPQQFDETQRIDLPPAQPPAWQPQPPQPPQAPPQPPAAAPQLPQAAPQPIPPQPSGPAPVPPYAIRPGIPDGKPVPAPVVVEPAETQRIPRVGPEPEPRHRHRGAGQQPAQREPAPTQPAQWQPGPTQPAQPAQWPGPPQPGDGGPAGYRPPSRLSHGMGAQPPGPPRSGGARRLSPAAIVGIVVACCAVAGFGAAAAFSGGDGEGKEAPPTTQGAASATSGNSGSPAADPAEQQAVALDALLKDSNSSRSAVINAVAQIKTCKNLDGAADTLRNAANQRTDLVTRLGQISIDQLPAHQQLNSALVQAWQSSAAADNHYANWANQVAKKGGCHKGKARLTGETAAGNTASGKATAAKQDAARLWNAIANKYGLTQRTATDL